MLSYATLFLATAAAVSSVNAHSVHRRDHRLIARTVNKPATYLEGYLEPYKTYHIRYLAIDCEDKHNTTFFDDCCHPMLATETLEKNRKAYCKPNARASSSASAAEPTSTVIPDGDDDDEEDCEDDEPVTSSKASATTSIVKVVKPTPKPSTTAAPHTSSSFVTKRVSTTSEKPAETPKSGGGKFDVGTVHSGGIATFFTQNGVAGACGKVHKDSDLVAAMTSSFYGSFSKTSSVCGRHIEITRADDGRKVVVEAADGCPTCDSENCLDLSVGAFKQLATENEGIAKITWKFID